tara:strand:- start:124763 stop:128278 length:3516 start_codon:yes stop_codon:yes gene_type:complete
LPDTPNHVSPEARGLSDIRRQLRFAVGLIHTAMTRLSSARLFSLAALAVFASCSGSGSSTGGLKTGGDFIVLSTEPSDNAQLFLNDPISIDFSNPVDLDSVDLTTFSFQVFDQIGNTVAEPVAGSFQLAASPGDTTIGRRLQFVPVLPTNNLYTNGGFRPGRTYQVQLVGGNRNNGTVLRDTGGKSLAVPKSFRFSTADGTTPGALFSNTKAGGPRRVGFEITPTPDTTGVVLNKLGGPPVEIRLLFDQPLNPSSANVPVAVVTDPVLRNSNSRGRAFLEYDDPVFGDNRWIPADAELEFNGVAGSTLVLRPLGVLPNNAQIRVIMERTLEDISGESNVANVAFQRIFGTFRTKRSYEQQFDGIVDNFLTSSNIDTTAAFSEPAAEVGPGYLKAGFNFEGTVTGAEFEPTAPETVLNTNFTLVTPKNGSAYNVSGGVFNFNSVTIPAGKIVRGQGTNPMVWLVSGTFDVAGTLSVRGGNGQAVNTSGNANVAKAGGAGVCGGGDGGAGSPSSVARDLAGGTGNGPSQVAGRGGRGGTLSCTAGCGRGAGGGGGSLATQGDPNFKQKIRPAGSVVIGTGTPPPVNPFAIFQQQNGTGGNGCVGLGGRVTRNLEGAVAGPTVFVDARTDNNYWGVGVRYDTSLRITGELALPIGGGGGGGGGDLSYNSDCGVDDPNFGNDSSGGGGGGGGGVLIVKALGPIIIRESGTISADGGSGGGGEPSSSSTAGGGGGGGSGGMVVLMSADSIEINARGNTFTNNDYDFSISADGGVCVTGNQPPIVTGKYPASGTSITEAWADTYDSAPLGGFGGMGIVQLMAPPGDPLTSNDGTNTILDDNIRVLSSGALAPGPVKQAILAWRGFPNALGNGVDDSGAPINIGDNEGDIRPSPTLLPTAFASKSRLRSKWIDTGATARRDLGNAPDELPRGLLTPSGVQTGPTYEWAGVEADTSSIALGYADYVVAQGRASVLFPEAVAATGIQSMNANSTFLGRPAYRVQLTQSNLGATNDRYNQYEAELLAADGSVVGSHRIMSHTANELVLSTERGALDSTAVEARIVAKFFEIQTNGEDGLGGSYIGNSGARLPVANVRFGFAFHQNPQDGNAARYPATPGTFAYNLTDPAVQEEVRALGASFVQWDILFDTAFKTVPADGPPSLNPETNRPELRFLRMPFRF